MIYSVKCEENNMLIHESDLAHFVHEVAGQQKPGDVIRGQRLQIARLAFISSQPHLKCSVFKAQCANSDPTCRNQQPNYIYIYGFIQRDLQCIQAIHVFYQYVCSLGIEPMTFGAANAMLYHWATGTDRLSSTLSQDSRLELPEEVRLNLNHCAPFQTLRDAGGEALHASDI